MKTSMRRDVVDHIRRAPSDATLRIHGDLWELFIVGVSAIERDLFVQLALLGPRACLATIRVSAAIERRSLARLLLDCAGDWLASGDPRDRVFLELPVTAPRSPS
jgi:hypothetical protein